MERVGPARLGERKGKLKSRRFSLTRRMIVVEPVAETIESAARKGMKLCGSVGMHRATLFYKVVPFARGGRRTGTEIQGRGGGEGRVED